MASTMPSNAQAAPSSQPTSNGRPANTNNTGRGRESARGDQSSNRGRGRGRGRGDRHNGRPQQGRPAPPRPPPDDLGGGVSGTPSRDAASERAGEKLALNIDANAQDKGKQPEEETDAEVCFICATPVVHNSIAPCNHRTCHICALRLRALYKTRACAHCRTEAPYLIFTDDAAKRFEDFTDADMKHTDETLGIRYTDNDIHSDTVLLLRYNCPDQQCDVACLGWPHLHHHVKSTHHKIMCDLCTRNKKVFTHEHELFTPPELRKHEKFGDDNPGAVDQSGFKGHPECGFCKKRFYGDDELYTHCRERHERCHICDRRRQGGQQQYFLDYDSLEQHFKKDHFLCPDRECLEKKFVVFESEMDMKAHQLEMHPNGLTKDARRDARRVDISTFDYREPHREPRRGGRERDGHRPGRGRDPNTEPLPHSTAQPLRRDELAYQRQLAIASAQAPPIINSPNRSPRPGHAQPVNAPNSAFSALSIDSQSPQQQARQIAHEALISRASALLGHDAGKLASFRSSVSTYQRSAATTAASDLITTFFSLFDVPASVLGGLIHDLAHLYENEQKRDGLLLAWNEWRAINEDYPSLPAGGGAPGDSSGLGGATGAASVRRVLKLKSSTAGSARGQQQQQQASSDASTARGWGTASAASVKGPAISNTGSIAKVGTTTPWASGGRSGNTIGAAARPTSNGNVAAGPKPNTGADNFPALPAAKKPNVLIAGLTRGTVRPSWETPAPSIGSAWGSSGASSGDAANGADGMGGDIGGEAVGGGIAKKKGNKGRNKGEVLYKFG